MTVSRFKHVKIEDREYTISFNSASDVSVTTYVPLTEEGFRMRQPEPLTINGIDYDVNAWINQSPQDGQPWRVKDVRISRKPFSYNSATPKAITLLWDDMRTIMSEHVVDDLERQEAGYQYRVVSEIGRMQDKISDLQGELDSLVKALEHSRNKMVST